MTYDAFIVNPKSANGRTGREFSALRERILASFPDANFYFTERVGHAAEIARNLSGQGCNRIIAVGGDGTINEVLNGCFHDQASIQPGLKFGVLPMGTGGDLVRTLKIPKHPLQALANLKRERLVDASIGYVKFRDFAGQDAFRYFVNIFSFGMSGSAAFRSNQQSKLMGGTLVFMKNAVQSVIEYRPQSVEIIADGKPFFSGPFYFAAFANGRFFGGGMHIAPQASLEHTHCQMVVVKATRRRSLLANLPRVYMGTHLDKPYIQAGFAQTLEAYPTDPNEQILLELDGETPGMLPIQAKRLNQSLRMIVGSEYQ